MAENCNPLSISLPQDLQGLLEEETHGVHGKKSAIIQEELYNRYSRKKHILVTEKHALIFLSLSIMMVLGVFCFLLLPSSISFLPILLLIALASVILCFIGMFFSFKKEKSTGLLID